MNDEDKIRRFSPKKVRKGVFANRNKLAEIKNYLGFEYVKLKKDVNGISFNKKMLNDFANTLKYTVSVMRETDGCVYLYEYFISSSDLNDFFKAHIEGKIEGEIIQIEKYTQDSLA